jgi:predicted methyltransferase
MSEFIQKQIESSERLYKIMLDDHKERVEKITEMYSLSESLLNKIKERDEEIVKLRRKLSAYEMLERM